MHMPNISILFMQSISKLCTVKALVQVDFPVCALSKHKQNLYLKANRKKWLSSQSCHFVKNMFLASNFSMQMFNESTLCRQSIKLFQQKL